MAGRQRATDAVELFGFLGVRFGLGSVLAGLSRTAGLSLPLSALTNPLLLGGAWLALIVARREPLRRYGLFWPAKPLRAAGAGLLLFVAVAVIKIFGDPLLDFIAVEWLGGDPAAQGRSFGFIRGDLGAYLKWLALVWIFAAVGEELFFRGLVLPKLARSLGDGRLAWCAALTIQAALFGLHHVEAGSAAVLNSAVSGFLFGGGYLLFGRSLLPVVIAHGLWDTFGLSLLYFGLTSD